MNGSPYVRACVRRGDRVGSALPVSLTGLGSYGGSLGGVKANAVGGNLMKSPKHGEGSVVRFSVNLEHSVSIWILVWRSDSPHGHATGSCGWNLALYSPMGAWFRIVLIALAQSVISRVSAMTEMFGHLLLRLRQWLGGLRTASIHVTRPTRALIDDVWKPPIQHAATETACHRSEVGIGTRLTVWCDVLISHVWVGPCSSCGVRHPYC